MISNEQEPTKLVFSVGFEMQTGKYGAVFYGKENNFAIPVDGLAQTMPYPGREFNTEELRELISFLQSNLKEMESHEQR
jgi:hypothetical protein